MHIKRIVSICLCILLVMQTLCLGGCGQSIVSTPGEGEYDIFYLKNESKKLYPVRYKASATDVDGLVDELITQFRTPPQDVDVTLTMNAKVTYMGYSVDGRVLYLYFDSNYGDMPAKDEIMCRAALAKTMTQIASIDYISIFTGDQPLSDSTGNPIGLISATDFIENISDVNSFERTELKLYFANSTGEKLVEEDRDVVYSINTSQERLIVEQLMEGPSDANLLRTVPENCKLLNVSVSDGICYVNFDDAFLTGMTDVGDMVTIYSIVNSLSELPSVSKVQISASGVQNVMFRDTVSLNTTFERNLDYIVDTQN